MSFFNQLSSTTLTADYLEIHNCDYEVKSLDGIDVIRTLSRTKAIHEKTRTVKLLTSKNNLRDKLRNATISMFLGPGSIHGRLKDFFIPVIAKEYNSKIKLANGFIWKLVRMMKTKAKDKIPHVHYEHSVKDASDSIIDRIQ